MCDLPRQVSTLTVELPWFSCFLDVAEVIEEHSKLAKTVGQRAIYAIIALHLLLWAVDDLPWHLIAFGIVCHIVYLTHFGKGWPFISLTSIKFVASCLLVLANHFLWFFHFSAEAKAANKHYSYAGSSRRNSARSARAGGNRPNPLSFMEVATLFVFCVWAIPFFLFLTLSANDMVLPSQSESSLLCLAEWRRLADAQLCTCVREDALPSSGGDKKQPAVPGLNIQVPPAQRTSILKSVLTRLMDALPSLRRGGKKTSRSQRDGLIASPIASAPPSPIPWAPRSNSDYSPSSFASQQQPQTAAASTSYFPNMGPPSPHLSPQASFQGRFPDRLSPTHSPILNQGPPPPRRMPSTEHLSRVDTPPPQGLVGRRTTRMAAAAGPDESFEIDSPIKVSSGKKAD